MSVSQPVTLPQQLNEKFVTIDINGVEIVEFAKFVGSVTGRTFSTRQVSVHVCVYLLFTEINRSTCID